MKVKCCICKKDVDVEVERDKILGEYVKLRESYKVVSLSYLKNTYGIDFSELEDVVRVGEREYYILCNDCYKKIEYLVSELRNVLQDNPDIKISKSVTQIVLRRAKSLSNLLDVVTGEVLKSRLYEDKPYDVVHCVSYYVMVRGIGVVEVIIPVTVFIEMIKSESK